MYFQEASLSAKVHSSEGACMRSPVWIFPSNLFFLFLAARGLSLVATLCWSVQASHCGAFSCGAWAQGMQTSAVTACVGSVISTHRL